MSKIWGPTGEFLGSIGDGPGFIMPGDGCGMNCLGCLAAPFILIIMGSFLWPIVYLIPDLIEALFLVFFVYLWPIGWGAVLSFVLYLVVTRNK